MTIEQKIDWIVRQMDKQVVHYKKMGIPYEKNFFIIYTPWNRTWEISIGLDPRLYNQPEIENLSEALDYWIRVIERETK